MRKWIVKSEEVISEIFIRFRLRKFLVGPSGLEPPTSCLSGTRSNLLSYEPLWLHLVLEIEEGSRSILFLYVSTELSSRTVARKVFSPLQSLTSVFGMGTGGPSAFVALTFFSVTLRHWILNNNSSFFRISPSNRLNYVIPISPYHTFSIERRWSSRTFRYGYLVTT